MTAPLNGGPSLIPPQATTTSAAPAAPQSAAPSAPASAAPAAPAMAGDSTALSGSGTASQMGATELWAEAVFTETFDYIGNPIEVVTTGVWSDDFEITLPEYKPTIADKDITIGGLNPKLPDNPTWRELVTALESALGIGNYRTDHRGYKRDVLMNDQPAFSTQVWGPVTTQRMREAYEALKRGDLETARRCYEAGCQAVSPIMLDLNGDGKLGTTGVSTAKDRIDNQIGRTVMFDIDGDGIKDEIEWMLGDGDGMLVDDRDGGATGAMLTDGEIDGSRLFGDQGGKYANGYEKLKALDKDGDGKLTGDELDGLKVWIDDGDAKLKHGELKSLRELGITEISVQMKLEANERGEELMRSTFVQNGETKITEDVWFAQKG